ncbi:MULTISPECIES: ATPase [Pseudomonas]|uniref:ATPase n=1 Tax=Pseudomonas gingeri TaxID=117681 RepID=A0A7Y7WWS9_9PSED|nr:MULTISPECIES: ATPase [Pseudomonas]MPQ70350.1 ATPase [Pseudomonas sp. MWU12-2323]NWB87673.1 ATPase [Pseudomonas gingeri]
MRNDANDDFDDVPSLRADADDHEEHVGTAPVRERTRTQVAATPRLKVKVPSTGPLWALVGALFIAFAGLAWWSFQQISLMEQQLVATQESFARISEEAAGRLQAISGKVVASESSVNSDSEALKLQIRQLEGKLLEQGRQQQGVAGQATGLEQRLQQMSALTADQQTANTQLQAQVKSLTAELASLKAGQGDAGKLDAQVKSNAAEIAALKKQGNSSAAVERIEQELIVLKSEQDNRQAAGGQAAGNTAEFDAFRGQVTRNITTLQNQIQNLQEQISAKPGA